MWALITSVSPPCNVAQPTAAGGHLADTWLASRGANVTSYTTPSAAAVATWRHAIIMQSSGRASMHQDLLPSNLITPPRSECRISFWLSNKTLDRYVRAILLAPLDFSYRWSSYSLMRATNRNIKMFSLILDIDLFWGMNIWSWTGIRGAMRWLILDTGLHLKVYKAPCIRAGSLVNQGNRL